MSDGYVGDDPDDGGDPVRCDGVVAVSRILFSNEVARIVTKHFGDRGHVLMSKRYGIADDVVALLCVDRRIPVETLRHWIALGREHSVPPEPS